ILQLSLESNADPGTFGKAVQRHIGSYFSRKEALTDTVNRPVKLKVLGRVAQAPVLNQVFLMNVRDLDTIKLGAYFDESERILLARVNAPHIDYGGNTLDSLRFSMDTNKEKIMFDLGFLNVQAGPLDIPETHFTGEQIQDEMRLRFRATHNDSILTNIKTKITGVADELHLRVQEDSLILNKHHWKIPPENEIVLYPNKITFKDFRFSHREESFELTDKLSQVSRDHAAVVFENFKLSEILNYLNPEKELAHGVVNGELALVNPFDKLGILANLQVNQFEMMHVDLGTLSINAKSDQNSRYDFNIALKEGDVDLDVKGNYLAVEEPKFDTKVSLNQFNMKALEGFSMGEIQDASGVLSGRFQINGTPSEPNYKGNLRFVDATFTVRQLNAPFTLANENIQIDNSGVTFRRFAILDENQNELIIKGKIGTEEITNPTFDLQVDADNFQFVNAGEDDNDFLHGKAAFDAHGTVTGNMDIPKIDMRITVDDNTDVTYILPSSTVAMESRDGIVMFVNREDPEAVLTRTQEQKAKITGLDINAFLKIGRNAKISLIINQETGDNFQIYGDGDLNLRMTPNGNMSLTGIYDVAGGHYEMNLYGLVTRKFELVSGSKVSWAGDPMDAALNVKALYQVETSASPLMAPVSSGADPSEKGKFRQVLPFYVYLNVDGDLDKPHISFDLDMPEDDRGAIGGQVYGRLQQVNQQEGELNRQIFSLLVMNRFYPEPGSDGSEGGFASIARDNLNDALSDQLNAFSNRLLGKSGFELDFGLDSYTDYQGESPQQRTQLDIAAQKKLFDDRLIVRVGSEVDIEGGGSRDEPTPLIGNVSLEYLLTENGRYRLKGFRKNSYENVIDGQTIVSGLSLIFTQEFNEFSELWQAVLHGETDKEKKQRRAEERRKARKEERIKNRERRGKNVKEQLRKETDTITNDEE
ncbi:MAG TPA: translocation/assembly module TamB domain-containing protein, partial [Flavobacteriaceae bacterium]|nr:translocation/assembly module TamB domain-containing protein [Flavobacteriaceae bacterium]